jgi:hypothetical protein
MTPSLVDSLKTALVEPETAFEGKASIEKNERGPAREILECEGDRRRVFTPEDGPDGNAWRKR